MSMPQYAELQTALGAPLTGDSAAEAHGMLCGLVCSGARDWFEAWIHKILTDAESGLSGRASSAYGLLKELCEATLSALDGGQLSFDLLLPDDETHLEARACALAAWCNAFLYGLASGGLRPSDELPAELTEILTDISAIGEAGVAEDDTEETGESAYMEIVEYVRVGVQIFYMNNAVGGGLSQPAGPACCGDH